jgi:hypothetical protein
MATVLVVHDEPDRREPARVIRSLVGPAGTDRRHVGVAGGACGG